VRVKCSPRCGRSYRQRRSIVCAFSPTPVNPTREIEAIGGAVKREATVPARVVEAVRDLLADGSFRCRDARR
jgi:hypothetical protein